MKLHRKPRGSRGTQGSIVAVLLGALALTACERGTAPADAPAGAGGPSAPAAPEDESGRGRPVTLAFAGDVHFEQALGDLLEDPQSTFGPMTRSLRSADLAMVNLESAVTDRGVPAAKELEDPGDRYWFRSPPSSLALLERSGVDVASVANNHGADYGATGLRDTLRAGRRSPVALVGAGQGPREAYRPHRTSVRGTDIAVLAADASPAESEDPTWDVQPGGPGLAAARGPSRTRLLDAVRRADRRDDVVVVYLHWGEEGQACPTPRQQALSAELAAAGADVVVGAHAHVLLGSGMRGDTYVSYGLGNFLWYHGRQAATGVLRLRVEDGTVVDDSWEAGRIPALGGQPGRLTGAERVDAVADWRRLRGCTDLAPGPGAERDRAAAAQREARAAALPAYSSRVREIGPALRRRMSSSFDPATCPVALGDLRHLTMSYVDFEGRQRTGEMVVAAEVAGEVTGIFRTLYDARWPMRRMNLVDRYDGDDNQSMAADNSSAYNCRRVAGSQSWSDHAYGRAIDLNPVENPYLTGNAVLPPAGRRFADVDRQVGAVTAPGVIRDDDVVVRAFEEAGWTWGGNWSEPDFQHFSTP